MCYLYCMLRHTAVGVPEGLAWPGTSGRSLLFLALLLANRSAPGKYEGRDANERGDFEAARRKFIASDELVPRLTTRLSAANMALKLGKADSAAQTYRALLPGLRESENASPERKRSASRNPRAVSCSRSTLR